jgi:hypothetical protein
MSQLFTCQYCSKSFKTPGTLANHLPLCREGRVLRGLCYKCGEGPLVTTTMCQQHATEMSNRAKLKRVERIRTGVCVKPRCGRPHSGASSQFCELHRADHATRLKKRKARSKSAGQCVTCRNPFTAEEKIDGFNDCRGCRAIRSDASRQQKRAVIEHYGGRCACPGCPTPDVEDAFLTMDHMNNDGNRHRLYTRAMSGTRRIYDWITRQVKRTGVWPSGFQVLCGNCNCGKRMNGGVCPHVTNGKG